MSIESGESFAQSNSEAERRRDFMWEHNPPNAHLYYDDKLEEIRTGNITWAVQDLTEQYGRVYDLFYKTEFVGYLDSRPGIDVVGYIPATANHPVSITIPGDDFFEVLGKMESEAIERLGPLEHKDEA